MTAAEAMLEDKRFWLIGNCVVLQAELIQPMINDARQITRRTFLRRVKPYRAKLGLDVFNDPFTTYFKSKYDGLLCYYYKFSGIEYVWVEGRRR